MGPPCTSKKCEVSKLRGCAQFTETDRQEIFKNFWQLEWGEKRGHIGSLVDVIPIKRSRAKTDKSTRGDTHVYWLKLNGERIRVCREMFLNTLGLARKQVNNWIKKGQSFSPSQPKRPVNRKPGQQQIIKSSSLKQFLESLPKMPSHYCRQSSTKMYLEPLVNSKFHLYKIYKDYCQGRGETPFSRFKFDSTFDDMNLSIFLPKKDQCDTCIGHEAGHISEETYNIHLSNKEKARQEKAKNKQSSILGENHCLVMDVQSVKLSPVLAASAIYYKTKLMVHNFTVYDLKNRNVCCYWWDESEADLVASSFASCLVDFIKENYMQDKLPIIIYSDGCTNQNRNAMMSNALLELSIEQDRSIFQKYLEKGHTQMECDSVHSSIETKLKNKTIYVPQDYIEICKSSRNPPYNVKYLDHSFFNNYADKQNQKYKSIRPGNKTGDACVTNIRQLKYEDGKIAYKLNYDNDSEWQEIPQKCSNVVSQYPKLYKSRQKITSRKFKDLQDLKSVIPASYHAFYDNLPHA